MGHILLIILANEFLKVLLMEVMVIFLRKMYPKAYLKQNSRTFSVKFPLCVSLDFVFLLNWIVAEE